MNLNTTTKPAAHALTATLTDCIERGTYDKMIFTLSRDGMGVGTVEILDIGNDGGRVVTVDLGNLGVRFVDGEVERVWNPLIDLDIISTEKRIADATAAVAATGYAFTVG